MGGREKEWSWGGRWSSGSITFTQGPKVTYGLCIATECTIYNKIIKEKFIKLDLSPIIPTIIMSTYVCISYTYSCE